MIDVGHKASTHYKDLRIWKDPITTLQTAMEFIQEESNHRQLGATQAAICDHGNITTDCDFLEKEITEPQNYLIAENHIVTMGMRSRGEWKEQGVVQPHQHNHKQQHTPHRSQHKCTTKYGQQTQGNAP